MRVMKLDSELLKGVYDENYKLFVLLSIVQRIKMSRAHLLFATNGQCIRNFF